MLVHHLDVAITNKTVVLSKVEPILHFWIISHSLESATAVNIGVSWVVLKVLFFMSVVMGFFTADSVRNVCNMPDVRDIIGVSESFIPLFHCFLHLNYKLDTSRRMGWKASRGQYL